MDASARALGSYLFGPNYYDERVQSWPLVDARSASLVSLAYVIGVPLGMRLMRDRKPYGLKGLAAAHNLFMTLLSLWMLIETLTQAYANNGWKHKFMPWGNMTEPGKSFSPSGYRLATVLWVHYISKAYEFMDTLIMILRKKNSQISFLHVYHHASTFFPCWWIGMNFTPGGDVYFACALNSFVHVCMYAYYLAASQGIRVSRPLKQSITIIQMVQFGLVNVQAFYGVFWATFFRPRIVVVLAIVQSTIFMTLFALFYRKAYGKRTPRNGVVPESPIARPSATPIDDSVPEKVTGREASAAYGSSVSKRPVNGLQNGHANGHSIFRHSEQ